MKDYIIRPSISSDAEAILEMVKYLAVQHNALSMIVYTADDLRNVGIGKDGGAVGAIVAEKEGKTPYNLVMSPNDKIKSAIVKYVPKFISNSAFK